MTSATEIRTAWPRLNEKRKTALVMSLYPKTQGNLALAANVVKLLDTAMGVEEQGVNENSLDEAVGMVIKGAAISGVNDQDIADRIAAKTGGRVASGAYGHHILITYPTTQDRAIAAAKIRKMFPGIELYKSGGNGNVIDEQGVAEGEVNKKDIAASKKKIDAKRTELEKQGVKKSQLGEPSYHLDAELKNANKQGVAEDYVAEKK